MKQKNSFIKRKVLLFTCMCIVSLGVFAQNITVRGTVTDANNEPIIGASVLVLKSNPPQGATTDEHGNYVLSNVAPNAILRISYVSMQTQEVAVKGNSTVNIVLKESDELLDEVVVVGYGVQKKASITGSVASIKGGELKTSGMANVSNTLAGRLPGVVATNRSGEPGADWSNIIIRGKGTLNNNSPLIVIDGVANRAGLERINPSDIESINVLKDASAAIYGAQAANGVILITTRRGTTGKPTITYNGAYTLSQFTRTPKLLNAYEYMTWADEIEVGNTGTANPRYANIKGGYLDGTINRKQYGDTDWMKATFRDFAPQTRHSISVNGGSENVKYYLSGDYFYQEPNYRNTVFNFQTTQLRSNVDAKINNYLTVNLDLAVRNEDRNNSIYGTGTMFWEAFNAYPFLYDYYPNGLPGPGLANGNNLAVLANGSDIGYDKVKDLFLDTKIGFDLKMPWITKGLSLSGYAAIDRRYRSEKKFWDTWDTYYYDTVNDDYVKQTTNMDGNMINLNQEASNDLSKTFNLKLNYERTFGIHDIGAFVAYEQNQFDTDNFWAWRGYYMSSRPDYLDFGGEKDKTNGGNAFSSARQNLFGRFNYAYKNRYLAEFTLRHDGSMNFPKGKRWGTFPGLSVGWRMSEEKFIQEALPFANDLKLRASWGKLGNDRVDAFQYLNTFNMVNGAIYGEDPALHKGFKVGRTGNPDITWEKVDSKNIGLDAILWNGLLSFSGEYFYQKRNDILTKKQASIPDYTGLILPDQNIGEVSNKGFELSLNHTRSVNEIKYYIGGNFTYTKNTILFFDEAANVPDWQRRTGHSMDTWLYLKSDGIYQTQEEIDNSPHLPNTKPGDIKYVDIDDDKAITDNDRIRSSNGNIPRIVYGINMGITWKGFEASMLWTGQAQAYQMIVPYALNTQKEFYDNRWISAAETPNAKYPRAFDKEAGSNNNTRWSDFWLYDASFIRLKNVEIAYNLPKEWTKNLQIEALRVFLTGNNLFTIDKIKFQDPESSATSAGQYYPQSRTYTVGLTLSF